MLRGRPEEHAAAMFQSRFHRPPDVLASAPGRVNLIGEHTDYNDGFVLPAAIDRRTAIAAAERSDDTLVIFSETLGSTERVPLGRRESRAGASWTAYVAGVATLMADAGVPLHGADICITSDVPRAAGLSSSAALELATAFALRCLFDADISDRDLMFLCQRAEHEFAGVHCGIMDQFVCCFGRERHALAIDCRSLDHQAVPIPHGLRLVVLHTGVHRALGASEYNTRRDQCTEAVRILSRSLPQIRSLRDVSPDDLATHGSALDPVLLRRARHVVSENNRVQQAVDALNTLDLERFGKLMYDSHLSLRRDYEVSCRELDIMVDLCACCDGVVGARMTGAGFGGAAICLSREETVPGLLHHIEQEYPAQTGSTPSAFVCTAESGARATRCS